MKRYLPAITAIAMMTALVCGGIAVQAQTMPAADTQQPLASVPTASSLANTPPPTPTSPGYVALLYYRLSGQMPDFEAWAMASDDYIKANSFDKDLVLREKSAEASRAYQLLSFDEPVVIETQATLSSYSRAKRGFFVEDFRPDTFYGYSFIGRNYAVVPLDLMDFQWLSVDDEAVEKKIEALLKSSGGKIRMYVYLTPTMADKETPLKLDKKDYWLLSGRLQKLQIYDLRGRKLLWEGYGKSHVEQHQQEVLDLYK